MDQKFITTIPMSMSVRANLDVIRAERAKRSGTRITVKACIEEALKQFVDREMKKHR